MKTIRIRLTTLALVGSAALISVNAEKVRFEELPTGIKDKIRVQSGAAEIEDVDRQTKAGKTTYEVAFKKNGQHTEMHFDEKGDLLNSSGTPALESRKLSYQELPDAVRKVVDDRIQNGQVNDVDRQVKDGKITYEVGFKQNGQQQELVISQDGRIINDANVPASAIGAPPATSSGTVNSAAARGSLAQPVTLSATQKVKLNELPTPVQKAIVTAAKGARVEDIERGVWQGQNIYQAGFKDSGKHVEVQVRENGLILHDPRGVGSPAARTTGRGVSWSGSKSSYPDVTSLVPLSESAKVEQSSLPAQVQRTITTHAANEVEDIERGTWQGKTIYQVAFKDKNGQHTELQIDQDGNVVFDPRAKR